MRCGERDIPAIYPENGYRAADRRDAELMLMAMGIRSSAEYWIAKSGSVRVAFGGQWIDTAGRWRAELR